LLTHEEKYTAVRRECETFHTDQLLENKTREQDGREVLGQIDRVRGELGGMKELQRLFYNFCSLVNHLEI
jgi:hypothetical protein